MSSKKMVCLLLTLMLVGVLAVQAQENKTALLIANGAYVTLGKLDQPVPEARQLRSVLQGIGFKVTLMENASREQMADALIDFQRELDQRGGTGFFHYGGHAVQVDGKNFLIPANANIPDEERVPSRSISLDEVARAIEASRASTSVIILDACRDNPLPRQTGRSAARGLSVVGAAPVGTIVVYSAQAGAVARDGVFTPALIRNLNKQVSFNEILQEVAREVSQVTAGIQRPFSYADLTMPAIYLAGRSAAGQPPVTVAPGPSFGSVTVATGSLSITVARAATVILLGQRVELPAGATLPINNVAVGDVTVNVRYADGKSEIRSVRVEANRNAILSFDYQPISQPAFAPAPLVTDQKETYKVGDRGPAGGIVFYDKGNSEGGWRYLEAGPSDAHSGIGWDDSTSSFFKSVKANEMTIGAGKSNTEAIIAVFGAAYYSYAAKVCHDLRVGGFSDWFLPSKDELNLMYANLKKAGVGGFGTSRYWSSSQASIGLAWYQSFSDGYQSRYGKENEYAVRAVRAFND